LFEISKMITLELANHYLLGFHIIAGSISLVSFFIPLLVKKGGNLHRKIGWIYVYTMWAVIISALLLSINNVFAKNYTSSLFLGFLAVLTAGPLWSAIAILKNKKSLSDSYIIIKRILSVSILIFGVLNFIAAFTIGFQNSMSPLLLFFGIIGCLSGQDVLQSRDKMKSKTNWLAEHLSGMIIGGIAAYTAFFAFGGRSLFGHLFVGYGMVIPWVLPTILGVILIRWYKRRLKLG